MAKSTVLDGGVTSYLDMVFDAARTKSGLLCYRGQAKASWTLRPAVMRGLKENAENRMFSELILDAPSEFGADRLMFDKLVRAQHYGLPTRLLDVSLNPLTALYFACRQENGEDGKVYTFAFNDDRVKFADSDTISMIANLSRLSDKEREYISNYYWKTFKEEMNPDSEKFRKLPQMKRLIQFVRAEKSYFLDMARPGDLFKYFFVYPSKSNARIIAQSGAFMAAGLLNYNLPDKSVGFKLSETVIPKSRKRSLLDELDNLNINSRAMFPEIESSSEYIKTKWVA